MLYKPGVNLEGLQSEMYVAIGFVEALWRLDGFEEPTITSGLDGSHKPGSLHSSGNALDIRTRNIPFLRAVELTKTLRMHLDPLGFDSIFEKDHIHIEYDPKGQERLFQQGEA